MFGATVGENQFLIPASYGTGTVTVTNNSTAVVGAGTTFTSAMVGRQLIVGGSGPFYTISAFTDATNITIERAFGGADAAGASYSIVQAYVTLPSDGIGIKSIKDPVNGWRLRTNIPMEQLDLIDPQRASTGTPWWLVDYRFTSGGLPRYELWPRQTSAAVYPFLYWRRPADLSADDDAFLLPIRGDVVEKGALADLARWPGTEGRPNPMFDVRVANEYEKQFQQELNDLMRQDQEIYLTDYLPAEATYNSLPYAPYDAAFMQNHDFGAS